MIMGTRHEQEPKGPSKLDIAQICSSLEGPDALRSLAIQKLQ